MIIFILFSLFIIYIAIIFIIIYFDSFHFFQISWLLFWLFHIISDIDWAPYWLFSDIFAFYFLFWWFLSIYFHYFSFDIADAAIFWHFRHFLIFSPLIIDISPCISIDCTFFMPFDAEIDYAYADDALFSLRCWRHGWWWYFDLLLFSPMPLFSSLMLPHMIRHWCRPLLIRYYWCHYYLIDFILFIFFFIISSLSYFLSRLLLLLLADIDRCHMPFTLLLSFSHFLPWLFSHDAAALLLDLQLMLIIIFDYLMILFSFLSSLTLCWYAISLIYCHFFALFSLSFITLLLSLRLFTTFSPYFLHWYWFSLLHDWYFRWLSFISLILILRFRRHWFSHLLIFAISAIMLRCRFIIFAIFAISLIIDFTPYWCISFIWLPPFHWLAISFDAAISFAAFRHAIYAILPLLTLLICYWYYYAIISLRWCWLLLILITIEAFFAAAILIFDDLRLYFFVFAALRHAAISHFFSFIFAYDYDADDTPLIFASFVVRWRYWYLFSLRHIFRHAIARYYYAADGFDTPLISRIYFQRFHYEMPSLIFLFCLHVWCLFLLFSFAYRLFSDSLLSFFAALFDDAAFAAITLSFFADFLSLFLSFDYCWCHFAACFLIAAAPFAAIFRALYYYLLYIIFWFIYAIIIFTAIEYFTITCHYFIDTYASLLIILLILFLFRLMLILFILHYDEIISFSMLIISFAPPLRYCFQMPLLMLYRLILCHALLPLSDAAMLIDDYFRRFIFAAAAAIAGRCTLRWYAASHCQYFARVIRQIFTLLIISFSPFISHCWCQLRWVYATPLLMLSYADIFWCRWCCHASYATMRWGHFHLLFTPLMLLRHCHLRIIIALIMILRHCLCYFHYAFISLSFAFIHALLILIAVIGWYFRWLLTFSPLRHFHWLFSLYLLSSPLSLISDYYFLLILSAYYYDDFLFAILIYFRFLWCHFHWYWLFYCIDIDCQLFISLQVFMPLLLSHSLRLLRHYAFRFRWLSRCCLCFSFMMLLVLFDIFHLHVTLIDYLFIYFIYAIAYYAEF